MQWQCTDVYLRDGKIGTEIMAKEKKKQCKCKFFRNIYPTKTRHIYLETFENKRADAQVI